MFKVLLADDEPLITKGLQALMNWEDYGFEVTKIAENGLDALEYIKEHDVDLLVTDIVMPKMTGLELIEAAKKIHPSLKCIVLSGYEEFDYIKQGIKLGIENYLIKPVDEIELEQTIKSTSEQLLASRSRYAQNQELVLKENVLWRLLNAEISRSEWEQRFTFYKIEQAKPFYVVSILDFSNVTNDNLYANIKQKLEEEFKANCVIGPNHELLMVLHGDDADELYVKNEQIAVFLQTNYQDIGPFYIAMGDVVNRFGEISESYFKAREYSLYQIVMEANTVISNQTHIDKHALLKEQQDYKTAIVKSIHESYTETEQEVQRFFTYLTRNSPFVAPAVSRKYTIDLVTYIHHSIQDVKHYNHTTAIEKLVRLSDNEQIREILSEYCRELIEAMSKQDEKRSPIVKDVLDYMHTSYHQELSLKTLSQRFHVNPIYLGQLFQKEMGIVFSEYINQFRLEKAKELLKTTHLRAGEIGKKVGYSDTAYFYKQFKKYVSVTPTEWRNI